jgi:hypothetical protein
MLNSIFIIRPISGLETCYSITRLKISQLVSKMCSHCLFPVVYKSGTSCYHLVTRLMRPTDSQQVVPTSLISSARNIFLTSWWQQARVNLLRSVCIILVGATCNKVITTCSKLVTATAWQQAVRTHPPNRSDWQQPYYNLFADL